MFLKIALRDAGIVGVALLVWQLAAHRSADPGFLGDFTGFVAGLLLGAIGFVLHEWGHLAGARATGAAVRPNHDIASPFIFQLDTEKSSLRQFLVTSLGGFLVTALIVWSFYAFLPDHLLASRVARGAALFLASLGIFLELPLLLFSLATRTVPSAAAVKVRVEGEKAAP